VRRAAAQYPSDPLVFVMRRLQDYWDANNRDSEISVFELAELPPQGDEVRNTYVKIMRDLEEYMSVLNIHFTTEIIPPREKKTRQRESIHDDYW